jgi:hemolysin activation/secretion protein
VAISTELRAGPFPINKALQIEPFAFYDVISLWNDGVAAFQHRTLNSVGGGARFQLNTIAHMDLVYAQPIVPPLGLGERRPGPTLLVNLTIGLNDAFAAIHQKIAAGIAK